MQIGPLMTWSVVALVLLSGIAAAQPVEIFEGTREIGIIDSDHPDAPTETDVIRTKEGRFELKPVPPWKSIKPGAHIKVPGYREGGTIWVPDPRQLEVVPPAVPQSFESPLPGTSGPQTLLMILARFSNPVVLPYTPEQALTRLTGEADPWLRRTSYQQTWLEAPVVTAWVTIAATNATCTSGDPFLWANLADAQARLFGFEPNAYARVIYGLPFNGNCSWSGLATLGPSPPTALWLSGAFGTQTLLHELGHNFGLRHSQALACQPVVLTWPCPIIDVGDALDVMGRPFLDLAGSRGLSPYNGVQRDRIGWFDDVLQTAGTIASSGVYHVDPYASPGIGIKTWRLPHPTLMSPASVYYLQQHQPVGDDAYLELYPLLTAGVQVHLSDPADPTRVFWLDTHPETTTFLDAALLPTETYTDPDGTLSVRVLSSDATGARVLVDRAEDTLSLQLLTPWPGVWTRGALFAVSVRVLIATQPAEGGLWEWGYTVPGDPTLYRPADVVLGPDGIWHVEVPLEPTFPVGQYVLYARASWETRITPIVSAAFTLQ